MRRLLLLVFCLFGLPLHAQTPRPGTPPAAAPGPDRIITIVNRAPQAVVTLFVSSTTEDNWGTNKLSIPNLASLRSFQLRLPGRECRFDFQVTYADKRVEEKRDQDICRNRQISFDATAARLPDTGPERTVTVQNRTPRTITKVFISPKSTTSWGNDVLGGTLASGDDTDLRYRGECVADLRIVYDNDSAEERREVNFCTGSTAYIAPGWTVTDDMPTSAADIPNFATGATDQAGDPLTIINLTGKTIEYLYIFPDGTSSEGPDRLGNNTLDDKERFEFRIDRGDQCRFTLRGEYANSGGEIRLTGLDLCRETEITLNADPADRAPPATATPRERVRPPADAAAAPPGPVPPGMSRLRNAGQTEVVALFVDPIDADRSNDRLGDRTLDPGESFDLAPPVAGQCIYKVVALYRDGRKGEIAADLCHAVTLPLP